MIFVNQVAEIVHQITADYCGSANKNIGDAFLLVWKLEDRFIKEEVNNQGKKELKLKNVNRINQICDMVLICFIRILIEINKSYKLAEYRHHKGLNARMKNYKTRLGFGLHLGQSIEGAIGSMFKIDASYLSTDVNMANELEENTKTFKKELIMSGDFYDYLSEDAKAYVRLLDIFKSKSGQITRLYSIDLDLENIPIEKQKDSMFKENNIEKKWEIIKQKRKISKILYDDIVIRHKSDIWNEFVMEEDSDNSFNNNDDSNKDDADKDDSNDSDNNNEIHKNRFDDQKDNNINNINEGESDNNHPMYSISNNININIKKSPKNPQKEKEEEEEEKKKKKQKEKKEISTWLNSMLKIIKKI